MTYKLMADYYSKAINILKLDSTYVIGWSDGGNTALLLAKMRPDKVKKNCCLWSNIQTRRNYKRIIRRNKQIFRYSLGF
jgi:hypothetical protein